MTTQRKAKTIHSQKGAVAIIVALSLLAMIGVLGLVLDLGHLYVAKTELQNAADAAALSGAKQLNGKLTGICCGVNSAQFRAIEAAGENKYDLNSTTVTITAANLWVGDCPDDGCMVPISSVTSDTLAADKTFLKVDTSNRNFDAWFSRVWNILQTQTFGLAVAGKYEVDITPIGICRQPDPGTINELGFERGVAYQVSDFNPIGPGTMYWLDPESNTPGSCSVTNTSGTLPYICTGKTGYTPVVGQTVNTNTGISDPQLEALDSRFDVFNTKNKCDIATAPPDRNIKEYIYSDGAAGSPSKWMHTPPNLVRQSIAPVDSATNGECKNSKPCKPIPYAPPTPTLRTFNDYGVLWSGFRPVGRTTSDWPALYSGGTIETTYPEPSPYAQASGNFFRAPTNAGKSGRRVLNIVILECLSAGGVCRPAVVLGVGRFLMQKKANQSPGKNLYVEFGGLLPNPLPTSDIKLYR